MQSILSPDLVRTINNLPDNQWIFLIRAFSCLEMRCGGTDAQLEATNISGIDSLSVLKHLHLATLITQNNSLDIIAYLHNSPFEPLREEVNDVNSTQTG